MAKLVFLTGTSCVGKTTVANYINKHVESAIALDVDEHGTPDTQHVEWLKWRSAQLLHDATEYVKEDSVDVVISGVTWPFEVITSTAWEPAQEAFESIWFTQLVIDDKLLKERLYERLASRPKADRKASYKNNLRLKDYLIKQVDALCYGELFDVSLTDRWTPERITRSALEMN